MSSRRAGDYPNGWRYTEVRCFYGDHEHLFGIPLPTTGQHGYGRGVRAVAESTAIAAVTSDPEAIAAVAWSAARHALDARAACAVRLGGVTPTETSLRDRSYPAAVHATFVYKRRNGFRGLEYAKRWYLDFLRSVTVRELLTTSRGRKRLLP